MGKPFPSITGQESAVEQSRMIQELREWRRYWLQRLYGGLAILAVPAVIFGGLRGWIAVLFAGGFVVASHFLIHARLLAVVGAKGEALVYKVIAGAFTGVFAAACVWWLLTLLGSYL